MISGDASSFLATLEVDLDSPQPIQEGRHQRGAQPLPADTETMHAELTTVQAGKVPDKPNPKC